MTTITAPPILRIEPSKGWVSLKLRELWGARELLYFLTWRDVKVRYKQTVLGSAWAILQPLLTVLIFTLVFGRMAKMPSDGIPYQIFSMAGLVPWTFFAYGLTQSSNSLVSNSNVIKKVYFPRLAIPISNIMSGLVDFAFAFLLLLGLMLFHHVPFTLRILWVPALLLLTFSTSLGAGLWLSALSVQYRDVRYVVPFLIQFWMYATPIVYPASILKQPWRSVFACNPMTGVVEGFRWAVAGGKVAPGMLLVGSSAVAAILVISGALYFRRMEKTFADLV